MQGAVSGMKGPQLACARELLPCRGQGLATCSSRCMAAGSQQRRAVCRAMKDAAWLPIASAPSKYDLVLSSGFLAFAAHSGFLKAVDEAGLQVAGVMGTSAGALAGSLYCAGYTPRQVAAHLSRDPPINLLSPSLEPWKGGALSLDRVVSRLKELLPSTFEELNREFAVGVVTADGEYMLIDKGPLPEAVAASAAIPFIFAGVDIPGHDGHNPFKDGGLVDRVGIKAWRERRRRQLQLQAGSKQEHHRLPQCLVHVIHRSSPFSGSDDRKATGEQDEPGVCVVHSPKSGVNFFDLGNFEEQMSAAYRRARPKVDMMRTESRSPDRRRVALPV